MAKELSRDFKSFAIDRGLLTPSVADDVIDKNKMGYSTPLILEERVNNVTSLDIWSRMLYERIIFLQGHVDDVTCNTISAQLLYLSSIDGRDINLYINSPGGSVVNGLSVIDVMNYIPNSISTTCIGMAASMGAVLLSCGDRGKRYTLPHGRIMIHQVSTQMAGTVSDIEIEFNETLRCKRELYTILAKNTGHSYEEIEKLCDRNNWFVGQEAVELGIVDSVLERKN